MLFNPAAIGECEEVSMTNIPTDLLRTLIAVVDLRSFTKAAHSLSVTQPAVSAQIKRLQTLLGYELFDKSAPGVTLTPRGEVVVAQARRLLAINDEILQLTNGGGRKQTLRVGIPSDYSGSRIPATLAKFRLRWPEIGFIVSSGTSENLLRDLKQGDLDVAMALSEHEPMFTPRHMWMRKAFWVHSEATRIDPNAPVPLVSYAEDCACQRIAVAALQHAGRDCNMIFTGSNVMSLAAAVAAGLGVMVMPSGRVIQSNLSVWADAPLPSLPPLYCGIYLREGGDRDAVEELADHLGSDLRIEPTWESPTVHPLVASNLPGEARH
jgi:DNA-binding transcriptional LysR family regulator